MIAQTASTANSRRVWPPENRCELAIFVMIVFNRKTWWPALSLIWMLVSICIWYCNQQINTRFNINTMLKAVKTSKLCLVFHLCFFFIKINFVIKYHTYNHRDGIYFFRRYEWMYSTKNHSHHARLACFTGPGLGQVFDDSTAIQDVDVLDAFGGKGEISKAFSGNPSDLREFEFKNF